MKKERQSNIELLRVIAMLMIVANHFVGHGVMYKWDPSRSYQLWSTGSYVNRMFSSLLSLGGEIGVGIFFIIAGYFLSKCSDFKFPKRLVLETAFYGIASAIIGFVIYVLHVPLREMNLSLGGILRSALIPVTGGTWWFVTAYFFLVLLAPVLNKMLSKLAPGGDNKRVISTITILWGFIYALGQFALFSQLEKAIFFYALGYYYRKDKSKKLKPLIFLVVLIAAYGLGTIIRFQDASLYANGITGNRFTLGEMLITVFIAPLCAYIWFTLFERNRMNDSRRINKIASTTFGVYLIHESIIGRPLFWYNILCVDTLQYESFLFPIFALISVVLVFVMCGLMDICREKYIQPLQMKLLSKFEVE